MLRCVRWHCLMLDGVSLVASCVVFRGISEHVSVIAGCMCCVVSDGNGCVCCVVLDGISLVAC